MIGAYPPSQTSRAGNPAKITSECLAHMHTMYYGENLPVTVIAEMVGLDVPTVHWHLGSFLT